MTKKLNMVAAACKLQSNFVLGMRLRLASALVELINMTDKPIDCWSDIVAGLNLVKIIDDTYSSGNAELIAEAAAVLKNVNKRVNRGNAPIILDKEVEVVVQLLNLYGIVLTTISYGQYIKALDKLTANLERTYETSN